MATDNTKSENPAGDAETIVSSLRRQYQEWGPIEGNARKRLWQMLGDIYAAIPIFEGNTTERYKLNNIVRQDENVRKSERFKPNEELVVDLLLVSVLSLCKETSATKSQWRAALVAAKIANVGNSSDEFQEWLAEVGGIVSSTKVDLSKGAKPQDSSEPPPEDSLIYVPEKFNFKKFASGIATTPPEPQLKLELDPEADVHENFCVALLYCPPGETGKARLVEKLGDGGVVKFVASKVAHGYTHNLPDDEKEKRALDQHLWVLNRVALSLVGRLRLKITLKEFKAFRAALNGITKLDVYEQKYFEGFGGVYYRFDDRDAFSMKVHNPDFLEIDPGRYFKGARKEALIPYDHSHYGTPEGDAAIKSYISQHTEPWRFLTRH